MDERGLNSAGERVHTDDFGNEYVLDELGNRRPPMYTSKCSKTDGFTTYDTDQGHCCLCGNLLCRGSCFK
jgi:hypothetical protein